MNLAVTDVVTCPCPSLMSPLLIFPPVRFLFCVPDLDSSRGLNNSPLADSRYAVLLWPPPGTVTRLKIVFGKLSYPTLIPPPNAPCKSPRPVALRTSNPLVCFFPQSLRVSNPQVVSESPPLRIYFLPHLSPSPSLHCLCPPRRLLLLSPWAIFHTGFRVTFASFSPICVTFFAIFFCHYSVAAIVFV